MLSQLWPPPVHTHIWLSNVDTRPVSPAVKPELKKNSAIKAFSESPKGSGGGCQRSRKDGFTTEAQSARSGIDDCSSSSSNGCYGLMRARPVWQFRWLPEDEHEHEPLIADFGASSVDRFASLCVSVVKFHLRAPLSLRSASCLRRLCWLLVKRVPRRRHPPAPR
jgi:hypothetical protein